LCQLRKSCLFVVVAQRPYFWRAKAQLRT
jgi:hypothetical protein